jgi:DNA-binding PadR family transcriptional regulator
MRKSSEQTLAVFGALLERPRVWRHGYDLSQETGLKSGTLYPVLMRLADRGFLESQWAPSEIAGRPPRRLYRLTGEGLAHAREELSGAEAPVTGRPARGHA